MIRPGETAADIGTDHGYVPMLLVRDRISPRVIMSDISASSLAKARETFQLAGLDAPEDWFRVGDGLATVAPGEVDVILIGGLGGHTIRKILEEDPARTRSFKRLVLQPRKHAGALREYLWCHGYDITEEVLTREGKFICEIIAAEPSQEIIREPLYRADDIRWAYPEAFRGCDRALLQKRLDWKTESIRTEIRNLSQSREDQRERIRKLEEELSYLLRLGGMETEGENHGEQ
ncbi:MAG: SAM-dependent methyltransferase [Mogibacterium sp.]|nr:SAM-dependent methyltransferase [Mogibacterium sp.]